MHLDEIIQYLKDKGDEAVIRRKEKKFGVYAHNSFGLYQRDLKELLPRLPKDNQLALDLFDTNIYEARLLCSKLYNPKDLTPELMEKWVVTFENWEICDSFCMALFAKSTYVIPKTAEWVLRAAEFEKRAGFANIAAYCMADKKADNTVFEAFFPMLMAAATDERIYVKKAVNWALRNIGKRNIDLHSKAIETAEEILKIPAKSAQWIAKDALKELHKEGLRIADYPRAIYRPKK